MFQTMLERLFLVGLFLEQQSWAIVNWIYGMVLTSNMKMITLEYLEREECKSLGLVIPPNHIQFLSAHFTIFQARTLKLELNKHSDHKYNVFKLDLTLKGLTWEPSIGCKLYQEITNASSRAIITCIYNRDW